MSLLFFISSCALQNSSGLSCWSNWLCYTEIIEMSFYVKIPSFIKTVVLFDWLHHFIIHASHTSSHMMHISYECTFRFIVNHASSYQSYQRSVCILIYSSLLENSCGWLSISQRSLTMSKGVSLTGRSVKWQLNEMKVLEMLPNLELY